MRVTKVGNKGCETKAVNQFRNGLYEDEEGGILLISGFHKAEKVATMLTNLEVIWKSDEEITLRPFGETESVTLTGN